SRCLLDLGKTEAAGAALDEIRKDVSRNQNPVSRLLFAIADARAKSAASPASRSPALVGLQQSIREAGRLGLVPLQYEAQMALDELELSENPAAGKKSLESLESRARAHGLELIARHAAALRTRQNALPANANPHANK